MVSEQETVRISLAEVIQNRKELYDSESREALMLYAPSNEAITLSTMMVLVLFRENSLVPAVPQGMKYFLEIELVKDVLEVWSQWRDQRVPTLQEACEAICYYASHDAYLSFEQRA